MTIENIVSEIKKDWTIQKKKVIDEFVQSIRKALGERAMRIILYGSRARGDADEESDYDFLVLVEPFYENDKRIVSDISTDISYDNNCYVSARTIRNTEFTEDRFFLFL